MSRAIRSVAMTEDVEEAARKHLLRDDGQEDLCFALWRPSYGKERHSALIQKLLFPKPGERNVHGNASFEPDFFERALAIAGAEGAGLALLHSHPAGRSWQGMSPDDIAAEQGNAGAVFGATERPFIGLTVAGDGGWSARFWERTAPRTYSRSFCASVRVVGERMKMHYFDKLAPVPKPTGSQVRTISSWGDKCQADLARLRVGVIGVGSVGGIVADVLGRTGFEDIMLLDFDEVEEHNLDRLIYATRKDIGRAKIDVLAEHLKNSATANRFNVTTLQSAIYENEGLRAALDCDVLFSCVDRPWGRYILNLIAYAHLIPVFDGGIAVRTNRYGKLVGADWRAHTATPTRPCLQCLGQYDPSDVQLEREGFIDDPAYISGLPNDHSLKARENVYAFAMSCASMQVLQMLSYTIAPADISNPGAQLYHFVNGNMEVPQFGKCKATCEFPSLIASGDDCYIQAQSTGPRSTVQHKNTESIKPLAANHAAWWSRLCSLLSIRKWL